jgi:DNA modification methylase
LRDYNFEGQFGLEKTPEEYVAKMISLFAEIWRVLRNDGTLWLNLGDSYARTGGWAANDGLDGCKRGESGRAHTNMQDGRKGQKCPYGLKEKDIVGIPWRVAFALQSDGWYLRQDLIWQKINTLPESCLDRCTKAHEYVFLLSKNPHYYFDNDAIKEPVAESTVGRKPGSFGSSKGREYHNNIKPDDPSFRNGSDQWGRKFDYTKSCRKMGGGGTSFQGHSGYFKADGSPIGDIGWRNKRSVWAVATKPFKGAHFAAYPPKLIEPMILAGTSEKGCCSICGAPIKRVVERQRLKRTELPENDPRHRPNTYEGAYGDINGKSDAGYTTVRTLGWAPSCNCKDAKIVPCIVLDPFFGAGTTGLVCQQLGRNYIGLELNPDYCKMAEERIKRAKEFPSEEYTESQAIAEEERNYLW